MTLQLDEKAYSWLSEAGYDPAYGARPLKRVIQRSLQNPLATKILSGDLKDNDIINVTVKDNELTIL